MKSSSISRSRWAWVAHTLLAAVAIGAKESAVLLPALVAGWVLLFRVELSRGPRLRAALLAAAVLVGLFRLLVRRAETRNAALERLVAQRTGELQATIRKLQQETLTSATLAERNRLAGEIHDSLEQCFTGLSLQLETTANFASCPPEVARPKSQYVFLFKFLRSFLVSNEVLSRRR